MLVYPYLLSIYNAICIAPWRAKPRRLMRRGYPTKGSQWVNLALRLQERKRNIECLQQTKLWIQHFSSITECIPLCNPIRCKQLSQISTLQMKILWLRAVNQFTASDPNLWLQNLCSYPTFLYPPHSNRRFFNT